MTNEAKMKKAAKEFNTKFFENELDIDSIKFKVSTRMTRTRGTCTVRNGEVSITLASELFLANSEWKPTLLHEMIHAYQWKDGDNLNHGDSFKSMSRRIKTLSKGEYVLTRCTATKDKKVAEAVASKLATKTAQQYVVYSKGPKPTQMNFVRSLTKAQIIWLTSHGRRVQKVLNPTNTIRHKKNFEYILKWESYYPTGLLSKLDLTLEDVVIKGPSRTYYHKNT